MIQQTTIVTTTIYYFVKVRGQHHWIHNKSPFLVHVRSRLNQRHDHILHWLCSLCGLSCLYSYSNRYSILLEKVINYAHAHEVSKIKILFKVTTSCQNFAFKNIIGAKLSCPFRSGKICLNSIRIIPYSMLENRYHYFKIMHIKNNEHPLK